MSRNTLIVISFCATAIVAGALFIQSSYSTPPLKSQKLSSSHLHQHTRDKHKGLRHTSKLLPPYRLRLEVFDPEKSVSNLNIDILARIEAERLISDLKYEWVLSQNVRSAYGTPLSGSFTQLDENNPIEFRATFTSDSQENETVTLITWVEKNGEKQLISSAHYNTLNEQEVIEAKEDLAKKNLEYIEQSTESKPQPQ